MATLQTALAVARDEGDDVGLEPWDRRHNELSGRAGEITTAVLLPGADERLRPCVVENRPAGRREAEPPAGALGTTPHWPRTGRAAPLAHGRREPNERG